MCHDYSAALLVLVSQLGRFALLPIYCLVLNCSMLFLLYFIFQFMNKESSTIEFLMCMCCMWHSVLPGIMCRNERVRSEGDNIAHT